MAWDEFRFRHPLRVRWAEADQQGVVFNGHYLTYCDVCITEYWRAIGVRYPQDFHARGEDTFVRKATVDYHAPARFDDELQVCGRVAALGRTSLRFVVEMFRHDSRDVLVAAELVYVNAGLATHKPAPWPEQFRAAVRAYETTLASEDGRG